MFFTASAGYLRGYRKDNERQGEYKINHLFLGEM